MCLSTAVDFPLLLSCAYGSNGGILDSNGANGYEDGHPALTTFDGPWQSKLAYYIWLSDVVIVIAIARSCASQPHPSLPSARIAETNPHGKASTFRTPAIHQHQPQVCTPTSPTMPLQRTGKEEKVMISGDRGPGTTSSFSTSTGEVRGARRKRLRGLCTLPTDTADLVSGLAISQLAVRHDICFPVLPRGDWEMGGASSR